MSIKNLAVNTIRILSAEGVQKANSGHPGLPLGAAPMAFSLWNDCMNHNPENPNWINRDRFILSAGHGSMLLYSLLHIFGYGVTKEDLQSFRQWGSNTPGHPEYGDTVGVEATTGPLGQGFAMGVGMALAESNLAARFNKDNFNIIDHYTYVLSSDGCMMEGITNEAASFAGSMGLEKLIVLYDSNNISIEGRTDNTFSEDVLKRYDALGWSTFFVEDGNDLEKIASTIEEAKKTDKPSIIEIKTKIGYGSVLEDSEKSHGAPLGEENVVKLKEKFQWEYEEEFYVPEEVRSLVEESKNRSKKLNEEWDALYSEYQKAFPELGEELENSLNGEIPEEYLDSDEFYEFEKDDATRSHSGVVLNKLAEKMTNLIGGSADLAPSNKSNMKNTSNYSKGNREGRNIQFGVRELAMTAITNGIALHGGFVPYCSTFFVFADYMKPPMRLASIMKLRLLYVLTHDSIGVGEDGPTHEPIEQLAMLRSTPNMTLFRPCDAKETAAAYSYGLRHKTGPTAIALTRQKLENLKETGKDALKGAYVLRDFGEKMDIILMASGSEVSLIYKAAEKLEQQGYGVRVVSMPSMDVFEEQDEEYKERVLPKEVRKRISVEAGSTFGWERYVGLDGKAIGIDHFGASAPAATLFEEFGFTVERVLEDALSLLSE